MTAQRKPWLVARHKIDGAIRDRETSYPPLELDMQPLGTQLDVPVHDRELTLAIGSNFTILDEDGIAVLRDFLDTQL